MFTKRGDNRAMTRTRIFFNDLSVLLAIQVGAFVLFHLNLGLLFDPTFSRLIAAYDWPYLLYYIFDKAILLLPSLASIWIWSLMRRRAWLFVGICLASLLSAIFWHYPLITGVLFALGHIDPHGRFLVENLPSLLPQ